MQPSSRTRAVCVAFVVVAIAALGLAGTASAKLSGVFTRFEQCPFTNAQVERCLYSVTESGEVVLGSKKVPITKPVTLQGGVGPEDEATGFSKFFAATNGVTLSKVPQAVPGGLAGIINCTEIKEPILRASCKLVFENGVTGLNSTLELARPASEIKVSQLHLSEELGTALQMPDKIHLENPFLGSNCYVGSSSSPIIWNLTTGKTSPPAPNTSIKGFAGKATILEGGLVVENKETILVDNAWGAPGASGCGGFLVELILDPIINSQLGTTTPGHNTAVLNNTISLTFAETVQEKNQ